MVESNVTRSPIAQPVTSGPHAEITPAASCPIIIGGRRRPVEPSIPCTSLPQIPHALTPIKTSSAPQTGESTSRCTNDPYSSRTKAFIIFLENVGLSSSSDMRLLSTFLTVRPGGQTYNLSPGFPSVTFGFRVYDDWRRISRRGRCSKTCVCCQGVWYSADRSLELV